MRMLRHSEGLEPGCLAENELEDRSTSRTNKCFEPQ